jgi:hypothetical protein
MSYTNESGRLQILDESGAAAAQLADALAALGDAYEHLDDQSADRLEEILFRPLQAAYGLLGRTRSEFAGRHGLSEGELPVADATLPADPRQMLERAADAMQTADEILSELQDSLLPVEVGDELLRAGLSQVRTLISPLPAGCDAFISTLGR